MSELGYTVAPQPKPVVDDEARERAREVLALWAKSAIGLDLIPDFEGDPPVIDRIIQALNYVPALASLSRCSCGFTPPTHTHAEDCPVFGAAARGYTPPRAPATVDDLTCNGVACRDCYRLCKTGAETRLAGDATPAVELDADALKTLSKLLTRWQKLANDIGVYPDDYPGFTIDLYPGRIVSFAGEWVLRIGGGQ